jgi:hypothetical protein
MTALKLTSKMAVAFGLALAMGGCAAAVGTEDEVEDHGSGSVVTTDKSADETSRIDRRTDTSASDDPGGNSQGSSGGPYDPPPLPWRGTRGGSTGTTTQSGQSGGGSGAEPPLHHIFGTVIEKGPPPHQGYLQ